MVLVFGSANVDLVMPVLSLPRAGETVLTKQYSAVPGGKGANQALAAGRAGADTIFSGMVGDDVYAGLALSLLQEEGIDLSATGVSPHPTGCAVVFVDERGENAIAVASGANLDLRANQVSDELLRRSRLLLLQQEVSLRENQCLASRAKEMGVPVIYNLAPATKVSLELLATVDYLIVNEIEVAVVGGAVGSQDLGEVAHLLSLRHSLTVIITLGAKGVIAARGDQLIQIAAPVVNVVDTTGAGDTFCGYLAAQLARGKTSLEDSLEVAVQAATLACTRLGAQPGIPSGEEVFGEEKLNG